MVHDRVYLQEYTLPSSIAAMITKMFDDSEGQYYVITINSLLPDAKRKAVLDHELEHLYFGDYDSELTADQLEFISLIRETADIDFDEYVEFINDPFKGELYA